MKKLLALAVSVIILVAFLPTALAEDTFEMYAPVIFENNEDATVGSAVPNSGDNIWGAYSQAKHAATYEQESTGNKYLKVVNGTSTDTVPVDTSRYGVTYYPVGISDKASIEMKVKIPETELESGSTQCLIRFFNDKYNGATDSNRTHFAFVLSASKRGYYIRHEKEKQAFKLADYKKQWITLRFDADVTGKNCDVYCNGVKVGSIANVYDLANSSIQTISMRTYSEIHIDDLIIDTPSTEGKKVLIRKNVTAPVFTLFANDPASSVLLSSELVYKDDNTAYDTIGVIVNPLEDTSMPGIFKTELVGTDLQATWNVYKKGSVINYNFDNDNPEYRNSGTNANTNAIVLYKDGNALKLGHPIDATRNREYISANVAESKEKYEVQYDMHWAKPAAKTNFYLHLYNAGNRNLVLEIAYELNTSGSYTIKCDKKVLYTSAIGNDMINMRFVVDKKNDLLTTYVNGACASSYSFSELGEKVKFIENELQTVHFYTYADADSEFANLADVYIDNLSVSTYESVASVDASGVNQSVKVVKGRVPALTKTVATVLTDGSEDVLPIVWDAVDTSVLGEITVSGTVSGFETEPVTATVTVIEYPYEVSIADGKINVAQTTEYAPEAKLYVVSYTDEGDMTGVVSYDVSGEREFDATGNVKAFLFAETLKPLAMSAE